MKKTIFIILFLQFSYFFPGLAQVSKDSTDIKNDNINFIDEVVVTGSRDEVDIRHLPMSISVVTQQQINTRYEQSLLPVLTEQVPGFFTTSRGIMGYGVSTGAAGGMSLRGIGGSPTTGLLVLIDGHPQYMGLMGHPIADSYQSMIAEKVEVIRGPASVLYGSNAMGGVINIVTEKQHEDGMKNNFRVGYGSYNTIITEAANHIRKGRFSSVITASYNRTDGHRPNMEFEQYGGYAKLGYEFTDIWKIFGDINLTHFNASNPGPVSAPIIDNDSRITRGMASISLENNYSRTSGALKLFSNWGHHFINDGYVADAQPRNYRFNSDDRMLGVTVYQSIRTFPGNRITLGMDYQYFGGKAWNTYVDGSDNSEIIDKTENDIAGYIDIRQSVGNILTLNAGLRLDHHSRTGIEWVPQAGFSFYFPRNIEIKALVGKGFRNPTIRELYMFGPQNPDLLPERLINYEISYSQRLLKNSLSYSLNLYYINGDNMIQTMIVDGRPLNVNTGKIENWGIEFSTGYRINTHWSISANYSWLNMKNPVVAAPEHKLYAGGSFSMGKWNMSTGIQYIHGLYTSVNPQTKENFVLWNLRAGYKVLKYADIFVRGENLLGQRYEINAGYPMPRVTILGGININF